MKISKAEWEQAVKLQAEYNQELRKTWLKPEGNMKSPFTIPYIIFFIFYLILGISWILGGFSHD